MGCCLFHIRAAKTIFVPADDIVRPGLFALAGFVRLRRSDHPDVPQGLVQTSRLRSETKDTSTTDSLIQQPLERLSLTFFFCPLH